VRCRSARTSRPTALAAVASVAGALEVVGPDDRAVGVVPGPVLASPLGIDLSLLGMTFEHDGDLVTTAAGAQILGHPAAALVAASRVRGHGEALAAGTAVYVGRLTDVCPVAAGSHVAASFHRLGTVAFRR
jgi:2-keto-4-pentenoate hydratase